MTSETAQTDVPLSERKLSDLTDLEIATLTNELKDQQAKERPLVSPLEPLQALKEEYENDYGQGQIFVSKIQNLEQRGGYKSVRRMRGDGDCFYRAFLFGYLERLLGQQEEARMALAKVESLLPSLEAVGYQADITEDFYLPFRTTLQSFASATPPTLRDLEGQMNEQEYNSSVVVFLRLVTSAYLKTHADDFVPFLFALEDDPRFFDAGAPTLDQFCGHYVEPVGKEADHIAITALTRALGIHISIAYLDQSGGFGGFGGVETDFHEFEEASSNTLKSALLYRPGHYDLLYK